VSVAGRLAATFLLLVLPSAVRAAAAAGTVPLRVSDRPGHDVTVARPDPATVEVRTTGRDPYLFAEPADGKPVDPAAVAVLTFEYFSPTGTNGLEVMADPLPKPPASAVGPRLGIAQGWVPYTVDVRAALRPAAKPLRGVRIDLGTRPDKSVQLRNLVLRPQTDAERQAQAAQDGKRAADAALDARLAAYLSASYPASVTAVRVTDTHVSVEGTVGKSTGATTAPGAAAVASGAAAVLVELPLWADPTDLKAAVSRTPLTVAADGRLATTVDRLTTLDGRPHDRLLSRWVVAQPAAAKAGVPPTAGDLDRLSADHWVDDVAAPADAPPAVVPKSKKGLGGFHAGNLDTDLDDLGIGAVTVNVPITAFMRAASGPGLTPFEFAGRTWWTADGAVAGFDHTMLAAAKRGIVVSAIVLVPPARGSGPGSYARLVCHPDADPSGIFTMPNVTSRDGCEAYAAALEFLARRYSRPDGTFGRIHHYILHNEVDAGRVWTNAGEKSARTYLDLYHRSMRAAHLVARQHDPHAKAFISLTHHWAKPGEPRWYGSRNLLDLLLAFSRAEGDFDWAVAYHPYPQSLSDPRVWADTQATYSLDTPKVTFKNLEVLDAWARQPRAMYQGKRVRTIHLTEQGLNSKDYSEAALRDQAAGMAYAWAKVKAIDSIEAFQYHNWADNRGEGGLRIGLRRFPDDPADPLSPKPIWHLFKALGTPAEAAAAEPYRDVVGVTSWDEVRHQGPIP
jgi:hypothetical protein